MDKILTVPLPDIGEGVVEGEVIEWLKQVGDLVRQDEPVVIVMTDKATVELPAPAPGRVSKHYYKVGQIAIKDQPLYDIETGVTQLETKKVQASPATRKRAKELHVDLSAVQGSGPGGRVEKSDLAQLSQDQTIPLVGIPLLMAEKMRLANDQIPHFSYFEQLDATRLVQLRQRVKEKGLKEQVTVTYMPFIIKALSLTIRQFPKINSSLHLEEKQLVQHHAHNIGIAMSTKQGLIVPVLKDVQEMSLEELIKAYEKLKKEAAELKLKSQDMKEGTITISNFGIFGNGQWATPIINYPEAAILGVSRIHKGTVVKNDEIVIRDLLNLSWSFDHRIIDGELAANVSHHFCSLLQNPAALL